MKKKMRLFRNPKFADIRKFSVDYRKILSDPQFIFKDVQNSFEDR